MHTASSKPGIIHPLMMARHREIEERDKMLRPLNSALWNDPMELEGTLPILGRRRRRH